MSAELMICFKCLFYWYWLYCEFSSVPVNVCRVLDLFKMFISINSIGIGYIVKGEGAVSVKGWGQCFTVTPLLKTASIFSQFLFSVIYRLILFFIYF